MKVYFLIVIAVYIGIGIAKILYDYKEPIYNQPDYIRHPNVINYLITIIFSPYLWLQDFFYLRRMPKEERKKRKERKKLYKLTQSIKKNFYKNIKY
jgi:hypothetical protein